MWDVTTSARWDLIYSEPQMDINEIFMKILTDMMDDLYIVNRVQRNKYAIRNEY